MRGRKYIVNLKKSDPDYEDPHLNEILEEICKTRKYDDEFTFEWIVVLDGYVIDEPFNNAVNAFLFDAFLSEEGIFAHIEQSPECIPRVKSFLKKTAELAFNTVPSCSLPDDRERMDVFIDWQGYQYYFVVEIPKTFISEEKHDEFRYMGPDYLFGQFSPRVIAEYVLPQFYLYLAERDLLGNKDLRNIEKYKIGLH